MNGEIEDASPLTTPMDTVTVACAAEVVGAVGGGLAIGG